MMKAVWSGIGGGGARGGVSTPGVRAGHGAGNPQRIGQCEREGQADGRRRVGITFADADPDVTPTMTSAAVTIDVKARTSSRKQRDPHDEADDDLSRGSDTIAIANLTWTAAGAGFAAGTMSKSRGAERRIRGPARGTQSGTQTYKLVNTGRTRRASTAPTITYTLTAP